MKATVNGSPWANLKNKKAIVVRATTDADSNIYWRQLYVILRNTFSALLALQLSDFKKATMDKLYYYVYKANLVIEKNSENINNPRLFPLPEEDDIKNRYDYLKSSIEESDVDKDVGPGDDLDDSDKCNNTKSNDKSEDGNLSRKILHAFKCR